MEKNKAVALVLSIIFGSLGIDRFYLGHIGLGIVKLITGGGFGIWWIVDIILIATDKLKDSEGNELVKSNGKNKSASLILSIFSGTLGIDRFYLGYIGLGIVKLLTFGGCGIWWIIDIILIATNKLKDAEGKELEK